MNKEDIARCVALRQKAYHTNYYLESLEEIKEIQARFQDRRPKLLLHACCAVCASWPLEFLTSVFDVTVYFNNSNIWPQAEYDRRLEELKRYLSEVYPDDSVKLIVTAYDNAGYMEKLAPMKEDPEGFGRCFFCYATRMNEAYQYAESHGFDYFTTVMSISRQKDSQKMNEIGRSLSRRYPETAYFYSDFKKAKGQDRKEALSNEHHLYRQDYCGCIYSYEGRHPKQ
ncbi:MAG: epoxyqueuosine reductase QueH [Solobacterium sp.]|jgi:predicted adenine nucleotide alpha hydrolase (AANH) superfamily ATPase|nr:epoxyqueuosine reductase QueH [Solobacterium sp.]